MFMFLIEPISLPGKALEILLSIYISSNGEFSDTKNAILSGDLFFIFSTRVLREVFVSSHGILSPRISYIFLNPNLPSLHILPNKLVSES